MRTKLFVLSILVLGTCILAPTGLGQVMDLSDYLREGGYSSPGNRESQRSLAGKLGATLRQAVTEYEGKRYDRAVTSFTAALQMDPDSMIAARIYNARAQSYGQRHEFKKALVDAAEAVRLDSHYGSAYNTRGCAHLGLGNVAAARSDFDTALRLDPNFAPAQRNRELIRRSEKKLSSTSDRSR